MTIKHDVDGYGTCGVITQQLSFSVPSCEYEDTASQFPAGAAAELTCSNGMFIPRFYVASRRYNRGKTVLTCYDRTYTTDREILLSDTDYDSDGYITITALLSHIMSVCGFGGYNDTTGIIGSVITKIHQDNIKGHSCRDILDDLSAACMGCWSVQGDTGSAQMRGVLLLAGMGCGIYGASFTAQTFSKVHYEGTRSFSKISVSNGDKVYTAGAASSPFGTYETDCVFASSNLAGALYNRLRDYTYQAWQCQRLICDTYIAPFSAVIFGSKQLYVNYCTTWLTASGIYAAVGSNSVAEDELGYLNRTSREMLRRYRLGDILTNVQLNKNGINYVFRDEVNDKVEKYSFNVSSGGVTEYSGAMLSNVQPAGRLTDTADGAEFTGTYESGKKYTWGYTENADGEISFYRNEVTASG